MDLPIGFGDRVDPQQAGLALFGDTGGLRSAQTVAVDAAVYHRVRDVDALRAELARHALADHPQAGLRRGKVAVGRLAPHAAGCASEEDGAPAQRHQAPRGLPPDEEAGEAADPPEIFEQLG